MRKYVFKQNKVKIVVKDPENYRSKDNHNKIKVIFEMFRQSNKRNKKEYRKVACHLIPRGLLKKLGVEMAKNDKKEIAEGEVCLLEYE